MNKLQYFTSLRAKKLSLLIQDARLFASRSPEDCAAALDISLEQYRAFEDGSLSPTLPQMEALSFFLKVPLDHFWDGQLLCGQPAGKDGQRRYQSLRSRTIGTRLLMERTRAGLELEQLAEQTGVEAGRIRDCENGSECLSLPELETLSAALELPIQGFFDQKGIIGQWVSGQKELENYQALPEDLRKFISQPVNRPYLTAAVHLSQLPAAQLRALAELLLNITL